MLMINKCVNVFIRAVRKMNRGGQNYDNEESRGRRTSQTEDIERQDRNEQSQRPEEDATATSLTDEWVRAEPTFDFSSDTSLPVTSDDWSDYEEDHRTRTPTANSDDWYDNDEHRALDNQLQNDSSERRPNDRDNQQSDILPTADEWTRVLDNRLYQIALDDFNEAIFITVVFISTLAGLRLD